MKTSRLQNLAAVAAVVLLCVLAIWAQTASKTGDTTKAKKANAAAPKTSKAGTKQMAGSAFGQPTEIHLLPSACRAQETMVHANGKEQTPPGLVIFYSPEDVKLTMNPPGILDGDPGSPNTITVKANVPRPAKVLVNSTLPTYTHFTIGTCPDTKAKSPKGFPFSTSDPNDVIVP